MTWSKRRQLLFVLDVAFTINILFSSGVKVRKIVPKNENKQLIAIKKGETSNNETNG